MFGFLAPTVFTCLILRHWASEGQIILSPFRITIQNTDNRQNLCGRQMVQILNGVRKPWQKLWILNTNPTNNKVWFDRLFGKVFIWLTLALHCIKLNRTLSWAVTSPPLLSTLFSWVFSQKTVPGWHQIHGPCLYYKTLHMAGTQLLNDKQLFSFDFTKQGSFLPGECPSRWV